MGLTKADCTLLFYAKKWDVSFIRTLMLGRLQLYASKDDIASCIERFQSNEKGLDEVGFPDVYSEPLFKILGAETVDSLDFSDYEKATIIHDLNVPIPDKYYNSFTAIVDGGTIEHVFNFPVAIKNCMNALKVGGHYIGITPANNQMGHGFYQFSPELYYRIFSKENGFLIKKMFVTLAVNKDNQDWYEVADPKEVNSRIMLVNNHPLSLMLIAEKLEEKEIFENVPQQSDYSSTWESYKSLAANRKMEKESNLKFLLRKVLPNRVKVFLRNVYNLYSTEKVNTKELGTINTEHFRKVEL